MMMPAMAMMAPMPTAGLRQPRGAGEQSEHGQDHQSSPPHRGLLLSQRKHGHDLLDTRAA
jgi:hypothetical protein